MILHLVKCTQYEDHKFKDSLNILVGCLRSGNLNVETTAAAARWEPVKTRSSRFGLASIMQIILESLKSDWKDQVRKRAKSTGCSSSTLAKLRVSWRDAATMSVRSRLELGRREKTGDGLYNVHTKFFGPLILPYKLCDFWPVHKTKILEFWKNTLTFLV